MNVENKMRSLVYFINGSNNAIKVFHNKKTFRGLPVFCKRKFEALSSNNRGIMENCVDNYQLWDTTEIFNCSADNAHAVLVLNRPIRCEQNFVKNIWKTAQVTLTVDGGTDRWLAFLGDDKDEVLKGTKEEYLPNLITGDMDSISKATLQKAGSLGVNISYTIDESKTDYTKSLEELHLYCRDRDIKLKVAYVLGETSGRMDQIISGISTLHKSQKILPNVPIIQISKSSLTWLLHPGRHKIIVPDILRIKKTWCSLLPVGYPAKSVSTTGLKWNLDNQCLEIAGLVSSSNTYSDEPYVTVVTDTPIIWSMGIKPIMHNNER